MSAKNLWLTRFAIALVALIGFSMSFPVSGATSAGVFRWDIISFNSQGNPIPGGQAIALADNVGGSIASITLTGTGTFETSEDSDFSEVTGGGTYEVRNVPDGSLQSSGTYQVKRVVRFDATSVIPGTNFLGGLAVLAIRYSDGSGGILVVNCAVNAPPQVTEGVTATKGTVDYWSIQGGFTLFHVGTTF
jgi:hypothetical protein